ncbi:histidinol dehydrogenase [Desulfococcaceae bacterium HSG9]|nr:histidinol dehydrogenase [Desulfococcaceae bacterium HSG9]
MKIFNYPSATAMNQLSAIINRRIDFNTNDYEHVKQILYDIHKNRDAALIKYVNQFDSPDLTIASLKVTDAELEIADSVIDDVFHQSLQKAVSQIKSFHQRQLPDSWITTKRSGTLLGQLARPVDAAGVYVPGGQRGTTPLVSSVLMGVIPAKIAGVKQIIMVTPAGKNGTVSPHLLFAARMAGVDSIYKVGSAWAIGALAYGTETITKVDVIVGPGNIYVTLAKKIVSGTVGIDMVAGPSEIMVIADHTADPEFIAADLLSQAEHDILASSILVTTSLKTAEKVSKAVDEQLRHLCRRDIATLSLENYGAILVTPDLAAAFDIANQVAPEHLELQIQNPIDYLGEIRNAGAVFLGSYTPEPVGDYIAGPNHVLPTAGSARFSSALSVDNFIKKISLIQYSREAFERDADDIIRLAEAEGLGAHANSIKIRNQRNRKNSE